MVDVRRPQRDEDGEIVRDKKGKPVIDKKLNDTENIPLPLDGRSLEQAVEDYMEAEVLPYAPDAWVEPRKNKRTKAKEIGTIGYEIPFTRYFYEYTPLRPSSEILAEIRDLESSIAESLQKAGL